MKGILVFMLLTAASACYAHGPAQWIGDGRYENNVGSLCCGERDCGFLDKDAVHATNLGYEVHGNVTVVPPNGKAFTYRVDEVVPYSEAQPSPTGEYWRCSWPGPQNRQCFFAPPPGS